MSEKVYDLFKEYNVNLLKLEQQLKYFKKLEVIKSILYRNYQDGEFFDECVEENKKLSKLESLLRMDKLKLSITNLSIPKIIPDLDNIKISEEYLKESIKRTDIKKEYPKHKIVFKSLQEIISLKNKNLVILPKTIDYSNFKQGSFGDCYFISCIHALSRIPQLLNFIFGLNSNEQKNTIIKAQSFFIVKFFIDGEWKKIRVKNSFPVNETLGGKLVGVKPKNNEIFLMILEKAWALINGGYDKMEGGYTENIFELFLGCKCEEFYKDNNIHDVYNSIKENEKFFGTLSLCGSNYYKINEDGEKIIDGGHAYQILKTLEIIKKKSKQINDTCKLLLISNPHGKNSELFGSGINIDNIEKILEEEFGKNNKEQYNFILERNNKYEGTGIIYMPLKYYKDWVNSTSVCYCHFDCISYTCKEKNEPKSLYIYKVVLSQKQLFVCQILLPSFRFHKYEMDEINLLLKKDKENIINIDILLYYCIYGIKIIKKNNKDLNVIESSFSYGNENEYSSIREINTLLEEGEYFIFIYFDSCLDQNNIRFLCERKIKVNFIDRINEEELEEDYSISSIEVIDSIFKNDNQELLKEILTRDNDEIKLIDLKFKDETFLPGVRQCYLNFKKLFEELNKLFKKDDKSDKSLSPKDAIYSISEEGDAYNYAIIDPNSMNKIFSSEESKYKKSDFSNIRKYIENIQTMQFIDNLGYPYKVKNLEELIVEMKINKEPLCCLFSEYDEYVSTLKSSVVYFKLYHNKAMNEDILVLSDKSNDPKGYLKRKLNPLFIIILDVSGSMKDYYNLLQNQVIPQLLRQLGYFSSEEEYKQFLENLEKKKISDCELLNAMSSERRRNDFLDSYNLKNDDFIKFCKDIVVLITFSDNSKIYFFDVRQFDTCNFSGNDTFFIQAAENLEKVLNSVSRERSIRMLTFTDGDIHDPNRSGKKLDEMLNSPKIKHQMNSVSVRVCHDTKPDTKILMKLSRFSHPISENKPIVIYPNKESIDEMVGKILFRFQNDDMIYILKLVSELEMMSSDFTENYSYIEYFKNKNPPIRLKNFDNKNKIKNKAEYYEKLLKNSSVKIHIECEDLNESNFYDLISKSAHLIAKRILENKINKKDNLKDNKDIIYYFEQTEESFKNIKGKKLFELFKEINEDEEISKMNSEKLFQYINKVEEKTKKILEDNKKSIINYNFEHTFTTFKKEENNNQINININNNMNKIKKIFNFTFQNVPSSKDITTDSYSNLILDNTFCLFKSINDLLCIVYSNEEKTLIFKDINSKILMEKPKAHKKSITNIRHHSSTKYDYILTISASDNNIKIWNFEDQTIIFEKDFYDKGLIYSACFLFYPKEKCIIISYYNQYKNAGKEKDIQVFNFKKNKLIKTIKAESDKTYFIDTFYEINSNTNFIITGNEGYICSYDFNINELYEKYLDTDEKIHQTIYKIVIINNINDNDTINLID